MAGGADFSGKIAVVTGGAQGIGLAIARRLAAAGARVVVADVQPPADDERLDFRRTDVSCETQVRALFAAILAEHGGLDVLVNNAGVALEKSIEQTELAAWERVFAVNVRGVFLCAKHARAAMRERGGAIVNIGSIEARAANPLHAAYAASKGAVHSLTRNIALEYGGDNIRCNAIAPGWIDTPLNDNLLAQYPDPAGARAAIRNLHPVGRIGAPDDIAEVALWLAGDGAAFASGQIYVHDGGRTACLPLPPLPPPRSPS